MVQPDGVADHLGVEPMAVGPVGLRFHAVSLARLSPCCQTRLP
jgi:hypothetical protein